VCEILQPSVNGTTSRITSTRVLRAVSALVTDFYVPPPHLWLKPGARLPAGQPVDA